MQPAMARLDDDTSWRMPWWDDESLWWQFAKREGCKDVVTMLPRDDDCKWGGFMTPLFALEGYVELLKCDPQQEALIEVVKERALSKIVKWLDSLNSPSPWPWTRMQIPPDKADAVGSIIDNILVCERLEKAIVAFERRWKILQLKYAAIRIARQNPTLQNKRKRRMCTLNKAKRLRLPGTEIQRPIQRRLAHRPRRLVRRHALYFIKKP